MLDDYDKLVKRSENPIKIVPIVYGVFLALTSWIFAATAFSGVDIRRNYIDFLLVFLFVIINIPLIILGVITIVRRRRRKQSSRMWYIAIALTFWPIIWIIARSVSDSY